METKQTSKLEKLDVYLQTRVEGTNGKMFKIGEIKNLRSVEIGSNLPSKLNLKEGYIVFFLPEEVKIEVTNYSNFSTININI